MREITCNRCGFNVSKFCKENKGKAKEIAKTSSDVMVEERGILGLTSVVTGLKFKCPKCGEIAEWHEKEGK